MLDYFSWPSNLWRQGRIRIDAELARLYHRNEDSGGEPKILRCQTGATNALIASMLLGDRAWLKTVLCCRQLPIVEARVSDLLQGNLVKNRLKIPWTASRLAQSADGRHDRN